MTDDSDFNPRHYKIDEKDRFDGTNFVRFRDVFTLMLLVNNIAYLIKPTPGGESKDAPDGRDRTHDNRMLYHALLVNVNESARQVVRQYQDESNGIAAWRSLVKQHVKINVGSAVALLGIKRHLVWDGGDENSFDKFVGKFLDVVKQLEATGFAHSDHSLAQQLIERVPKGYLNHVCTIVLQDTKKLTFDYVRDLIKVNVRSRQSMIASAAFSTSANACKIDRQSGKDRRRRKTKKRVSTPCSVCELLGVDDEKAMHREADCWNAQRFPLAIQELRQAKAAKHNLAEQMGNLSVSNDSPTEQEFCLTAIETVEGLTQNDWVISTACTVPMTPFMALLDNYTPTVAQTVTVNNKERMEVTGRGQMAFKGEDGELYRIMRVLHVPALPLNFLATAPFLKKGGKFLARGSEGALLSPTGTRIVTARYGSDNLLHCSIAPSRGASVM